MKGIPPLTFIIADPVLSPKHATLLITVIEDVNGLGG